MLQKMFIKILSLGFVFFAFSSTSFSARYLVTITGATIATKKSTLKRWDTGIGNMTLPDVYVQLDISGTRLQTNVVDNTLAPTWTTSKAFVIKGDEKVYIQVMDKDLGQDDTIGKTSLTWNGFFSQQKTGLVFGKVLSLQYKVEVLEADQVKEEPKKEEPKKEEPKKEEPKKEEPKKEEPKKEEPKKEEPKKEEPKKEEPKKEEPKPSSNSKGSIEQFCSSMTHHAVSCMQDKIQKLKGDASKAKMLEFLKKMSVEFQSKEKSYIQKCVASFHEEQKKRTDGKIALIQDGDLNDCWSCIKKAGCERNAQKACQATCSKLKASKK